MQGKHQVAQKLTNTTWPLSSVRFQDLPFLSTRVKSGAILPTSATFGCSSQATNSNKVNQIIVIEYDNLFIITSSVQLSAGKEIERRAQRKSHDTG